MQEAFWVLLLALAGGATALLNSVFKYLQIYLDSKIKSEWGKAFTERAMSVGSLVVGQISQTFIDQIRVSRSATSPGGVNLTTAEKERAYELAFKAAKETLGEAYTKEVRSILGDAAVESTLKAAIENAVRNSKLNYVTVQEILPATKPEVKDQPAPPSDSSPTPPQE
jgi:hypothetical protein